MRLTCPRCGAQYEIAAAAIPAAGREVECSACSHVWFQPGQPKAAAPAATYDPQARPELNRPLNESILAILRDETARELQAREADAGKRPSESDQNIATSGADAPPPPPEPGRNADAPLAAEADAGPAEAAIDAPEMDDAHSWPATTLTVAQAEPAPTSPVSPRQRPAETPAEPAAEITATPSQETPGTAADMAGFAPDETPAPDQDEAPGPVVAALPDAAELAATLTRPGPPPALSPASAQTRADPAEPADKDAAKDGAKDGARDATASTAKARAASAPVAVAAKRGSGYASGFGLAAMLALGVVTVYALAPRVAADEDGGLLAEWRQEIDRGRLWLHDRILGE